LLGDDLVTWGACVETEASTRSELNAALREAGAIAAGAAARTGVEISSETSSTALTLLAERERSSSAAAWWRLASHLGVEITADGGVASLTAPV
jgi:glycine/D-amino acid oxidase-like deaminating enzyme